MTNKTEAIRVSLRIIDNVYYSKEAIYRIEVIQFEWFEILRNSPDGKSCATYSKHNSLNSRVPTNLKLIIKHTQILYNKFITNCNASELELHAVITQ